MTFEHDAKLAQQSRRIAELETAANQLQQLQVVVHVAAMKAGILKPGTDPATIQYVSLVDELGQLASRPAAEKDAVTLADGDLEIVAKGASIIANVTGDEAKRQYAKLQVTPANMMMDMHNRAKQLHARILATAKARGIDTSDDQVQFISGAVGGIMEMVFSSKAGKGRA